MKQKIGLNSLKYDYRQNRVLDFTSVENFLAGISFKAYLFHLSPLDLFLTFCEISSIIILFLLLRSLTIFLNKNTILKRYNRCDSFSSPDSRLSFDLILVFPKR